MIGLLKKAISLIFGKRLVAYICGAEALPKPLTPEEEEQYAVAAKNGDAVAREKLIEHNLRLVVYIAKIRKHFRRYGRFSQYRHHRSYQGGQRLRSGKKIKLATFAGRCIENEILMYLRKTVRLKTEVSLDEPLNVDGEGNELLLGDVLGTDNDLVFKNLETTVEKQLLAEGLKKLSERERKSWICVSVWTGAKRRRKRGGGFVGNISVLHIPT